MNTGVRIVSSILAVIGCTITGALIGTGVYEYQTMAETFGHGAGNAFSAISIQTQKEDILGHWLAGSSTRVIDVITVNRDGTLLANVPGTSISYTVSYEMDWNHSPPSIILTDPYSGKQTNGTLKFISRNKIIMSSIWTGKRGVTTGLSTQWLRMTDEAYNRLIK